MKPYRQFFRSLAFSPDGTELAAGTSSGYIFFFDPRTGGVHRSITAYPFIKDAADDFSCSALAFSPDGRLIASGKAKNVNLQYQNLISADIWDAKSGSHISGLPGETTTLNDRSETSEVWSLAWDPSGDRLAIADGLSLRLWKVRGSTPMLLMSQTINGGSYSVSFSPTGTLAAAIGNDVKIFN